MVMLGETVQAKETTCVVCGCEMKLKVLVTCAPYLGFFCHVCGPYSRETPYFDTMEEAEDALESGAIPWR